MIQEIRKLENEIECIESEDTKETVCGILGFLEQNPHIGQTKVFLLPHCACPVNVHYRC